MKGPNGHAALEREAALGAVTAAASAAATRAEILEAVLDVSSRVLEASAATAYLVAPRGSDAALALVASRGVSPELARALDGAPVAVNRPVARSVHDGAAVWVPTREALEREFPEFARLAGDGFTGQAVAALPLRVGGAIVAGFGLAFPDGHALDEDARALLSEMAARCEAALARALLFEESQAARADADARLRSHEIVAGILAHDLKNPLSAVLMNARMLRDAETDRTRGIGRRILTSGERMARMIDQILEWTRIRSGPEILVIERSACDLGSIVEEVVAELRTRKPDAQISVEVSGDLRGNWDADRLAQVVSHLVGNAVEHASRPGVSVTVDGRGPEVGLSVGNEGRIDEQILATIFEPFHGRERGARHRGRGLGLGLFITRQIVAAHGGRVELDALAGEAERVTLTVTLPR